MKKFKFLTLYNLKKVVFTKSFLISNLFVFLLIVLMLNLPKIINVFNNKVEEANIIVYYDSFSSENDEKITSYLNNMLSEETLNNMAIDKLKFTITYATTELVEENKNEVLTIFKALDQTALISFTNTSDLNTLKADIHYNSGSSKVRNTLSSVISQARIVIDGIDVSLVEVIPHLPPGNDGISEQKMIQMNIISMVISIPMLMIIIRALVFVGVDIVQEKSSKAIETIIASVPTKTHFFSKVVASLGFVIIQSLLMLVFGFIGGLIGGTQSTGDALSFINISRSDLILFLLVTMVFTVVSSLFYLIIGGILAAMSNTQEDYQVFQGPITMILLLGFYMNMFLMNAGNVGIEILKVMSFIPPFSGFTAPFTFAIGALAWWQLLISLTIFSLIVGLLLYFFGPVYRVSILNYEQTKFGKRIINNFKKARFERKNKQ